MKPSYFLYKQAREYHIPQSLPLRNITLATAIRPLSEVLRATFIMESTDDNKIDPGMYLKVSVKIREIVGTLLYN